MTLQIVKTGTWLYDGSIEKPVDIIAFDYDWWYEMAKADGLLGKGETPMPLGKDGFLYYIRFQRAMERNVPTWVDSPGYQDIGEAIQAAENKFTGQITWIEP